MRLVPYVAFDVFSKKLGYVRAGVIPDYALKPYGGLCGTIIYWKRL